MSTSKQDEPLVPEEGITESMSTSSSTSIDRASEASEPAAEVLAPAAFQSANGGSNKGWFFGWLARKSPVLRGNPLRVLGGGLTTLVGVLIALVFMGFERQFLWGVPAGLLGVAIAAFGVLDFLGSFDDPDERVAARHTIADLQKPLLASVASLAFTLVLIGVAAAGRLPILASAVLIPAAFTAFVVSVFQTGVALGPWALDEDGNERPIWKRHGFWVVMTGVLLYLPMQGSYSLSDPWETHYGEVARELLARNDWISIWWAQDGWFWSKPVLDFWMQGLAMGIFGVNYRPGQMLSGAPEGHTSWPEWALRMPVFVLTIVALYFLYKGVAKVFGRRAGLLGALILATMPQWYLLAHQTITDMPLVATLSTAMGLLMFGMQTDPEQRLKAYEVSIFGRKLRFTGFHLVFGIILLSALPQILYLVSRNVEFKALPGAFGFRWHPDEFFSGSKGNCSLPGNQACNPQRPFEPHFQPMFQALMWITVLGVVLFMNWGERRSQRFYFLAAWYFGAVATLGKGPAGFALPICVTFTYIAATRKWHRLLSLEIVSGLLIIGAVAIPWYLAMYIRHGQPFTDALIFQHMFKRAMQHIHDTNEGDDVSFRFYIWQLGYALFPWTGLVPAGLVWWARRRDDASGGQGDVSVFLAMWFVFAFGLFTAMLTKFHHYIFPAVPPAAMLTGIMVDRILGQGALASPGALGKYLLGAAVGAFTTVYGFIRLFPGSITGFRAVDGSLRPASLVLGVACIVIGVAASIFTVRKFGRAAEEPVGEGDEERRARRHEDLMLGGVALAAAIVVGVVGRDLSAKTESTDIVGQARLMHLFTYNYRRLWPESLEFSGVIAGFAIAFSALCVFLIIARWRRHIIVMMTATALAWAVWGLDVYLVKASPHWGQREVVEAYYKLRKGPEEPIIAYQMNWKGENFYTGNQIPAFVSTGATFTSYMKAQQEKGVKNFFFILEHSRVGGLKNEAGNPRAFETVTDKRLNNKFCLVKATFD